MNPLNFISLLTWTGQLGCAITIFPIVAIYLGETEWWSTQSYNNSICLISGDKNYYGACVYAYSLASVSIFLSILSVCVVFSYIKRKRLSLLGFALLIDSLGLVWWIIGASIIQEWVNDANDEDFPNQNWRYALTILSWTLVTLFGFMTIQNGIRGITTSRKNSPLPPPSPQLPPPQPLQYIPNNNIVTLVVPTLNQQTTNVYQPSYYNNNHIISPFATPLAQNAVITSS
jgi:hypothetical protein